MRADLRGNFIRFKPLVIRLLVTRGCRRHQEAWTIKMPRPDIESILAINQAGIS